MNKLETFLDQIYNNADKSLYFYIIIGGIALILILVLILASFKSHNQEADKSDEAHKVNKVKKEKKVKKGKKEKNNLSIKPEVKENISSVNQTKEIEDTIVMKPIINEEVKQEKLEIAKPDIIKEIPEESTEEKKDFSSVYLDIKPIIEEPIIEPEIELEPTNDDIELETSNDDLEIPKENLSINPDIFEKENKEPEEKEVIISPVIDKAEIKEEEIPNIEENNINLAFNTKPNTNVDMPINIITEEEMNMPIILEKPKVIEDELPKFKPEFLEEEKIPTEEKIKPQLLPVEDLIFETEIIKEEEKLEVKNEPVVLNIDDVRAKLEKLSNMNQTNSNENTKNTLDDLLKQIGVDESPEISNVKDEESILLGK